MADPSKYLSCLGLKTNKLKSACLHIFFMIVVSLTTKPTTNLVYNTPRQLSIIYFVFELIFNP